MNIRHVAIWVKDLEICCAFYEKYFCVKRGNFYKNQKTGFTSYFLEFDDGAKLELMNKEEIPKNKNCSEAQYLGINHIAISVGSSQLPATYRGGGL